VDDDEIFEFSVQDLAQAPQKMREACPVTFAVRARLVEMIDEGTFEEFEALATALITTVYNLELKLLDTQGDLMEARLKAMEAATSLQQVYVSVLDLETRLLNCGVPVPPSQNGRPHFPDYS